jgi:hypothetical protein
MRKVVKYRWCEPENVEIALEALKNGDISLSAISLAYPLQNDT